LNDRAWRGDWKDLEPKILLAAVVAGETVPAIDAGFGPCARLNSVLADG
jgi:hypothetical protein